MTLFPVPFELIRRKELANRPTVSIVVSVLDSAPFVAESLASLAAQTQGGLELIIVDDASTDDSRKVVASWLDARGDAFCGYTFISHRTNMGVAATRNSGFTRATADRVFVMDAANQLYPRAIERCMQAMTAGKSAGAYAQLELFGDRTGIGNATFWDRELFKPRNYIDATALVSKAAWERVDGYTQLCVDGAEDYDFWCKLAESGLHCTFVPEILCRYRVRANPVPSPEAPSNAAALVLELSVRHPWLDLTHFRQPS
jgi:glycosyltransferase involved in cell wall biosynthesis